MNWAATRELDSPYAGLSGATNTRQSIDCRHGTFPGRALNIGRTINQSLVEVELSTIGRNEYQSALDCPFAHRRRDQQAGLSVCLDAANMSQAAMKMAAITGPMTKPLIPKIE